MIDMDSCSIIKPGRYIGQEWNVAKKDIQEIKIKFALCFPDMYEIGMSNLGIRILYEVLFREKDVLPDFVFSPGVDMQNALRAGKSLLSSLEYKIPIKEFDALGFSLGYELCYTNILDILDLSGIPLKAAERGMDYPLIIGGGSCSVNPEPVHEFFDLFVIGEAEEAITEIIEVLRRRKFSHDSRQPGERGKLFKKELLKELAHLEGIYVPGFYSVEYNSDGSVLSFQAEEKGIPIKIKKRFIKDFGHACYPVKWIVPNISIIHDRAVLEIMRGCPNQCRFCQARNYYWPFRMRPPEIIQSQAKDIYKNSGYEEISLGGLSVSDYVNINNLIGTLLKDFKDEGVGISLSSLRADSILKETPALLAQIRKTTLTFAPEAGSLRLREVINKNFNLETMFEVIQSAYAVGYRHLKLYFMIGLPTEEMPDLDAIIQIVGNILNLNNKKLTQISVSISNFIPKPHTPFQWLGMEGMEAIFKKREYLQKKFNSSFSHSQRNKIKLSFHEPRISFLEAVFSRGDRRLAEVILTAWKNGARFDAWREYFSFENWQNAFKLNEIDPETYASRQLSTEKSLAWDHISLGASKEQMLSEFKEALLPKF